MTAQKAHLTYTEVVASIPTLAPEEQLDLLMVLSSSLNKAIGKAGKHSLLELEGLGADIWVGKDVAEYLRTERDAWN
jgi:hypothetical protein